VSLGLSAGSPFNGLCVDRLIMVGSGMVGVSGGESMELLVEDGVENMVKHLRGP